MKEGTTLAAAPPRRAARPAPERGPSLAERVSGGVQRLSYGTVIHQLRLRTRYPERLLATPADPIPGDATAGAAMLAGRLTRHGHAVRIAELDWRGPLAAPLRDWADGFGWARDLAATGSPRAHAIAAPLLRGWLATHARYDHHAWSPQRIGLRLLHWTLHADLLTGRADPTLRSGFLTAYARTARHLFGCVERAPEGLARLHAAAGACAAALSLPGADPRLPRAEAGLRAALQACVAPDGHAVSRAPLDQLAAVECLRALGAIYAARGRPDPNAAPAQRMTTALATLIHADGGLAAFHGPGGERDRAQAILRLAGDNTPAQDGGYQWLQAGGSVLILDAGPPPDQRASHGCHASTLSFEFGHGAERLIVNCGAALGGAAADPELAAALRTTAAHSTLVVADHNSTRLREDGCLGRGVTEVTVRREEAEDGLLVEAAHDGYRRRFGLDHRRRLFLSRCGDDLRGEDALVPHGRTPTAAPFALRFHLSPGTVAEAENGVALAALPSGAVWSFTCRDALATLEDSVVMDAAGAVRRTRQIVVHGSGPSTLAWRLQRVA